MNYSNEPGSCRDDFFRDTGKWYATEAIKFDAGTTYEMHPADALRTALRNQIGSRYSGMTAVCLSPYVGDAFPVMVRDWA